MVFDGDNLRIPNGGEAALMDYVDKTVILDSGQGLSRLPPSFHKGNFHEKFFCIIPFQQF